jgi:hypothetical protein
MHWRTDDLFSGLMFLGVSALFGFTALSTLEIGTPGVMGPGFFPIMVSLALAGLAVAIIVGARSGAPCAPRKPIAWRAVVCVIGAPVAFGLSVRALGLVPALLIAVTIGVLASRKMTAARGALIVGGMTVFCVAIFSFGIGLSVELFSAQFWRWR